MAAETENDKQVLSLFESAGSVETPTPGVRAWLAYDASNGKKPVLIKRLSGSTGKGRATEALSLIQTNIVRTRRWLAEGGNVYVIRDVVRGKNLRQSLASPGGTRPSPELIRRILLPVVDALEYAHGQGLPHGGISPENVLIGDEGAIFVSDFATVDPKAAHHLATYAGVASVSGDVKALGGVLATYLPTTGAFASISVRGRIEGLIGRCDTLGDLKETLNALEKLAASVAPGAPRPAGGATATPTQAPAPAGMPWATAPPQPTPTVPAKEPTLRDIANAAQQPQIVVSLAERNIRLPPGGGGFATLIVRNEGTAPLVIRMIATQHAWLNVRPMELPLAIAAGGSERVGFNISAARLTPGEYRSEVYLSANASGATATAEELRGGWFKHTSEVRISVDLPPTGAGAKPPYPADAPKLPGNPGCGATAVAFLVFASGSGMWLAHALGAWQ